ncbi:RecX family transcriptional regulator [Shewanella sp. 1CM18E]|uniref:RecX family transcriptional regulator n=1 Tax=Shewanella sp. 1CM18E TaxID=2929169 RepID=UPI0020BD880D|nr:RecX family transcriptional regulator [Shewanella sp. 1CM18E]MCK8047340.1 RecX family transcriptional regulator [Shewanella sp. 1CM18E]
MQQPPLRQAKSIDNVFNSAYWHLSQQDFTIDEIRSKLQRKTTNQQWIETVLARLIEGGYLKSDYEFAVRFCELSFSHELGAGAIKRKLQQRGLTSTDIENALEKVIEEQNIDSFQMASTRLLSKYDDFTNTNTDKIYSQMTNKGFNRAEINHAIDQHPAKDTLLSKLAVKAEKADLATEIIKLFKKGKGETLILQELKQRLIDVTDFENIIYQLSLSEQVDFYASCKAELAKKRYDLSDYKEKSKAYAYLSRKGFSSDEIKEAMAIDDE